MGGIVVLSAIGTLSFRAAIATAAAAAAASARVQEISLITSSSAVIQLSVKAQMRGPPAISNIGTEKWFNFRFNFLQWFTSKFQVQVLASFDLRDSCVYSHPARGAKPARARSAALALGPMHSPPDEKQRIRAVVSEAEFGKPHFPQVCQRLGCFWPKCFFPRASVAATLPNGVELIRERFSSREGVEDFAREH